MDFSFSQKLSTQVQNLFLNLRNPAWNSHFLKNCPLKKKFFSKTIFKNENLAIFVGTLKNTHDPPTHTSERHLTIPKSLHPQVTDRDYHMHLAQAADH